MQPTVFASYQDPQRAEVMLGSLLEAGVAPEDMSLLISRSDQQGFENRDSLLEESSEGLMMVDSGEAGMPPIGNAPVETEGSYLYASQIGGGISTGTVDDSVSGVEELDESQEIAEQMTYPASAASYSSNERFDVAQGANTGFFNTTKPGPEGLGFNPSDENGLLQEDEGITSLIVPGVGLVLGDGTLATEIIGAGMATERGGDPAAGIQRYLEDQNVPQELAFRLAQDFEEGGAIIAVATPPGAVDFDVLQNVFLQNGARNVELVDAAD